jgi:hypothetical protein
MIHNQYKQKEQGIRTERLLDLILAKDDMTRLRLKCLH